MRQRSVVVLLVKAEVELAVPLHVLRCTPTCDTRAAQHTCFANAKGSGVRSNQSRTDTGTELSMQLGQVLVLKARPVARVLSSARGVAQPTRPGHE